MYKMVTSLNTELANIIKVLNGESDTYKSIDRKINKASKDMKAPKDIIASKDTIGSKDIADTKFEMDYSSWSDKEESFDPFDVSQKNLQEAIIWSEILGKPMSKRRKSR